MRIDVALLAGQESDCSRSVCVVVDVLRASSSIVTLLERGARQVVAAGNIADAWALRERLPGYLLCGEVGGLPPSGFDYGNSAAEFSRIELEGRSVILATSNGTRLLVSLATAPAVLVGCMLNRSAVARTALDLAGARSLDITVVCAAAYGGTTLVLEDALGAGAVVEAALSAGALLQASDAARFARDAFGSAQSNLTDAVSSSYHAKELMEAGFAADVAYCAQLDVSPIVPVLERGKDSALVLLPYRE